MKNLDGEILPDDTIVYDLIETIYLFASILSVVLDILIISVLLRTPEVICVLKPLTLAIFLVIAIPIYLLTFICLIKVLLKRENQLSPLAHFSSLNLLLLPFAILLLGLIDYPADKLEQNYLKHEKGIEEVLRYTRDAMDDGSRLFLTFNRNFDIEYLQIAYPGDARGVSAYYPQDVETDSLIGRIGMSREELLAIRRQLWIANCSSIFLDKSGKADYVEMCCCPYCGRHMLEGYYYQIYDGELSDERIQDLDDRTRVIFNRKVCFKYSSRLWKGNLFRGKQIYLLRKRLKEKIG